MVLITPICLLRPLSPKNGNLFFKIFRVIMQHIVGIHVHIEGKDIIENNHPSVLIGNHQHNLDVLMASGLYTDFVVVLGKFELGLIPFFGQIYVLCGNILVKRGNRKKAMKSMKKLERIVLEKKLSVLVFPEGHRNSNEKLLPFKKGAFYTAVRTQTPLIPFSVSQFVNYQDLNTFKKVHMYIKVHQPITTIGLTTKDIPDLVEKSKIIIEEGILEMNKNY
jgi:1-acyl-sn-glycerol-3-phosphate acyltransferase